MMSNNLHIIAKSPSPPESSEEQRFDTAEDQLRHVTATAVPYSQLPIAFPNCIPGYAMLLQQYPWTLQPPVSYQMSVPSPFMLPLASLPLPWEAPTPQLDVPATPPPGLYRDYGSDFPREEDDSDRSDELFPVKLHKILNDPSYSEIITWMPHGRSWKALNIQALESEVLPKFFNHTHYASFMRQVNGWGFRRFPSTSQDHHCYYHEVSSFRFSRLLVFCFSELRTALLQKFPQSWCASHALLSPVLDSDFAFIPNQMSLVTIR